MPLTGFNEVRKSFHRHELHLPHKYLNDSRIIKAKVDKWSRKSRFDGGWVGDEISVARAFEDFSTYFLKTRGVPRVTLEILFSKRVYVSDLKTFLGIIFQSFFEFLSAVLYI